MKLRTLLQTATFVAAVALSGSAFAQNSAQSSASATANILTSISLTKNNDLSFGDLATDGTDGTVVIDPAGSRSSTGGVTLATGTTVSAASFTVGGASGATYSISLPTSIDLTDGGSNTMTVDTFTSDPTGSGTLTAGSETLNVGATLHVVGAQAAGSYSGTFSVTVAYN